MEIVLISGLPGSGKSTLANYYEKEKNFIRLGSDSIRSMLYSGLERDSCKYHTAFTRAVFEIMYLQAELYLKEGKSIVLDGIHRNPLGRSRVLEIARKYSIQPLFIEIFCSPEILRKRIASRNQDPFDSEADLEILENYLQKVGDKTGPDYEFKIQLEREGFQVKIYDGEKGEFLV